MLTGEAYRDYLLHQAQSHPGLQHTKDNLVFQMTSVEDAIGDLQDARFSIDGYLMRGIEPAYAIRTAADGLPQQQFQGGVLTAKSYSQREEGTAGYQAALDAAETLMVDIIEKMYADSEHGHPAFEQMAAETLAITSRIRLVAGDGSFAGWIMLFTIDLPTKFCAPAERVNWLDGGLTPFDQ